MKRLQDFINESIINESEDSKSITFDFTDLENAEDTLKSLEEKEGCSVEDNKLTVTITKDNVDKFESVQDILQQFCSTIRNSSKRSSDEQYAQKTVKFEKKVNEFNNALDEINALNDESNDDKNKEDNKGEDE